MSTVSPDTSKKMEKELVKEEKVEEARIKHLLDDLASTGKAQTKAEKAVHKASNALAKSEKKEFKATKAANKATHDHDIAVTNRHGAEQEEEMKRQQNVKLQKELQAKKKVAEEAMKDHDLHKQTRDIKLAELRSEGDGL